MKHLYRLAFAALLLAFASCTEKESTMPEGAFRVADEYLNLSFTQDAQYQFIPVESNVSESQWVVNSSAPWCVAGVSISGDRGLMISVDANEEKDARTAKVVVRVASNAYLFTIRQLGYGAAIIVGDVFVDAGGGTVRMKVTSNIPYEVGAPELDGEDEQDWLTRVAVTRSLAESEYSYKVQPNYTAGRRYAKIAVKAVDRSLEAVDAVCTITQDLVGDTAADDVLGKVEQMYAKGVVAVKGDTTNYYSLDAEARSGNAADFWYKAGSPLKMIDGDYDSYYCSPRGLNQEGDDGTKFPFELIFDFENVPALNYMRIYPYSEGGDQIASFNLYYKEEGMSDFVQMNAPEVPYTCPLSGSPYLLVFDKAITNPVQLKIEVLGTHWQLVKIKEVEFYKTSTAEVHDWILRVFEDYSCTSLRSGVKKDLINQMAQVAPYIAKNAAMPLYQKTYSEGEFEFRAHSYEAYSDPAAMKQKYNLRYYTELDNPTGILVKNGESLVVCVDKVPAGHSVKLVVNGDNSSADPEAEHTTYLTQFNCGTSQFSQTLSEGVNMVPVKLSGIEEGLVFIVHTDNALTPSSEPVKVHILPGSGTVLGYFDLARHDDARFKEMLTRYSYKYFIQKGENIITAFHTAQLRKPATSGGMSSGLRFLDQIYSWEWDLLGLHSQTEFNNHIMVISSETDNAFMDAGDTRVRLGAATLGNYATEEQIRVNGGSGPWGIAHEMGHINQPAICWESTIESSNNLFSNYCIWKSGVAESRGYSIKALADSYGLPWYKLGNTGQYQNEDAELHMRMNWQLWNYFHRCLGDEDFWPRVFAIARENPAPGMNYRLYGYNREDPGTCQLMFYEQVCEAAGMDLTEFFDTWGFFREVSDTYGQYVSGILYSVTSSMIAESKARVAAKGYPKAPAIQYLEDRTRPTRDSNDPGYNLEIKMGYYTTFRDKVSMSKLPKYTLSGRNVKVSDCEQAVAVEVRSKSTGELLYFSNLAEFTIPARTGAGSAIDLNDIELQAVQWDGVRKKM